MLEGVLWIALKILLLKPYVPIVSLSVQPPLGLLYLISSLRERFGKEVEITFLDLKSRGLSTQWVRDNLHYYDPDVVGVSVLNCEASTAYEIATICKEYNPNITTAIGGPYAHRTAENILTDSKFDWVFDGPSERTFTEAISRLKSGEELGTDIAGFSYRSNGSLHLNFLNDLSADLDTLPFPAWDLIDFELYARLPKINSVMKGRLYAPLFTSRGCPFKCHYCHDIFGKKFISRSAESVLNEIEHLHTTYGVDEIEVVDDIFNWDRKRVQTIMGEVSRRWAGKIHFCFPNGLRGDMLDEATITALANGGTYSLAIAIESTTPRIQKLIDKNLNAKKAYWAINFADSKGIAVLGFFMLGFPTETVSEMKDTIDFALKSRLTLAQFFTVIPQPHTPIYDLAKSENHEALARFERRDLAGLGYYSKFSWYGEAYGYPLNRLVVSTWIRFYLNPRRIWKVFTRTPKKSLFFALIRLVQNIASIQGRIPENPPILPENRSHGIGKNLEKRHNDGFQNRSRDSMDFFHQPEARLRKIHKAQ